jgi:hypothetical protein
MVAIKFTNSNTAASPTLNVKGSGAKPILRYGTTAASTSTISSWMAGGVVVFIYDGENWYRTYNDTNTTYTNASLGQGYCTCSTAAATAAKTASLSKYDNVTGGIVAVKFTNGNTVANPTLNINSQGAFKIFWDGAALTNTSLIKANDLVSMIFDGTQYHIIGFHKDKGKNIVGTSATATSNGAVTGNGVYLNHISRENAVNSTHKITGGGSTKVTSDSSGNITITTDLSSAMTYLGITTTELTDGATTTSIVINGTTTTVSKAGSVVIYNDGSRESKEFVWNGSKWELLGDSHGFSIHKHTVEHTPAGSVS